MRKINFSKLAVLFLSAAVMSSCGGLKKMKDLANTATYDASPKVLEMHNGEVELSVKGNYPAKYFNKKAVVTIQPVLKYEGGDLQLKPIVLQGEAVQGNDKVIKYAESGSFEYSDKFEYKEGMMLSEVSVIVTGKMKDKTIDIGTFKVADGIVITPKLVQIDPKPIMIGDKFVRIKSASKEADIKYVINRYDIRPGELNKEEIKALNDYLKSVANDPKFDLKGVVISSYTSPDGALDLNTKLVENREKSATGYLKNELKKSKVEKVQADDFLSLMQTAEDWDGFKQLMEKSTIQDKELILRVLSMYSDPEVREREIKNISKAYEEIADQILPELRRSKLIIKVDAIGFSDEEMITLAESNPDTFSLEEILYAANLIQDLDKKAALYKKASEKYATDVRAINNLGYVYVLQGKLDEAKTAFESAKAIDNTDVVKANLATVALLSNDLVTAEELYTSAMNAGDNVRYALGIINIIKGKYEVAKSYYGTANEYNSALAKVLNKNYEDALSTLSNIKEEKANVFYLRSIIGARIENTDMLFNNLRTAVGKDAQLKAYAKKDVEFIKYFTNETFKSIVE